MAHVLQWICFTKWLFLEDSKKSRKNLEFSLWVSFFAGFVAVGWLGFYNIYCIYYAYVASLFADYYDQPQIPNNQVQIVHVQNSDYIPPQGYVNVYQPDSHQISSR